MEIETLTDRVQKFADELEAEKAILCTCKELFMNLSDHFKARKASLSMRSQSVEVKLQSLESSFRQTLESLSEREDSIPLCESEAVKQVQQRKQAAISEIEKPVSGDLGLPETLRSISMRMDSLGLIKFLILKRREPALLKAELPASINEAIDPPRLVLNAVEDFLDSKAAKTGTMDKRWAVGLLVHALFPDLKSDLCAKSEENVDLRPKFAKSVVDRALRVLERWKGQVGTSEDNSDFGRFGPLEALMFLEMVVGFGLKSQFDEVFLKKMVVEFSSRREMAKLVPCLGLGEKLADIVGELVKKGKEIDAIYFVTELGATEKFSPVSLLKSFLKNSKKNAMDALQKGNNSPAASEESRNIELNAIRAVVKCVEDQKLESVFSLDVLKKRANALEKAKAEKKRNSGPAPSSSKSSGKRKHNSGGPRGSDPPLRPEKVVKTAYYPPSGRRTPAYDPAQAHQLPSSAARYNAAQHSYPGHDAYEVSNGNPPAGIPFVGLQSRYPSGISQAQYSPIIDASATPSSSGATYYPSFLGEQTTYTAYEYGSAGHQAYQPTDPSYSK